MAIGAFERHSCCSSSLRVPFFSLIGGLIGIILGLEHIVYRLHTAQLAFCGEHSRPLRPRLWCAATGIFLGGILPKGGLLDPITALR